MSPFNKIMKKFLIKRIVTTLLILFFILILIFILIHLAPGNPYINSMKPGMSPEQIEKMLVQRGYYDSLPLKFLKWIKGILFFDFGYSMKYNAPVIDIIFEKLPNTLFITIPSFLIALFLSIKIGIYIAFYKNGFLNKFIDIFSMIGLSTPSFLISIFLIKVMALDFGIFPISGIGDVFNNSFKSKIYHAVLPILVLTFIYFVNFVRFVRGYMFSIIEKEYIRTYEGFGMKKYDSVKSVGFRNILPNIFTIIFLEFPNLISGALITETIFVWQGIGKLNFDAVLYRDYPLILGILTIISIIVLFGNLFSDIINYYLDKRIGI